MVHKLKACHMAVPLPVNKCMAHVQRVVLVRWCKHGPGILRVYRSKYSTSSSATYLLSLRSYNWYHSISLKRQQSSLPIGYHESRTTGRQLRSSSHSAPHPPRRSVICELRPSGSSWTFRERSGRARGARHACRCWRRRLV